LLAAAWTIRSSGFQRHPDLIERLGWNLGWVAYDSNESGVNQIYIRSFPDPTRERRQVSTDRGSAPHWRHDGRELYYLDRYAARNENFVLVVTAA